MVDERHEGAKRHELGPDELYMRLDQNRTSGANHDSMKTIACVMFGAPPRSQRCVSFKVNHPATPQTRRSLICMRRRHIADDGSPYGSMTQRSSASRHACRRSPASRRPPVAASAAGSVRRLAGARNPRERVAVKHKQREDDERLPATPTSMKGVDGVEDQRGRRHAASALASRTV